MSQEAFDQIIAGQKRLPAFLVKNAGIRIKLKDLPNYEVHAFCRNSLFGAGRLSAIWCQHIRPYLFPKRQAYIESVYNRTKLQQQQELLNEVILNGSKEK